MPGPTLTWDERLYYRDRFRAARYSALADAEGFGEICFVLEALGLRLKGKEAAMGYYFRHIRPVALQSTVFSYISEEFPALFTRFESLYETVRNARNDAMHTGVYARHATTAAIELCIGMEEALMVEQKTERTTVADYMVKGPVTVEPWQPVAHARQLMLMYSFSYLPVFIGEWLLVPEVSMAKYLHRHPDRRRLLATPIEEAATNGLDLVKARVVASATVINDVLGVDSNQEPMLWLVQDDGNRLCGILSPFELM
jgi:CBS domain-containing protein